MKKLIICIIAICTWSGCNDIISERLYYKFIQTPSMSIEWFFYSTISNTTPDYVIVNINDRVDTLCIADNIIDVNLEFDTIKILFNGSPKKYETITFIKSRIENADYVVVIDTMGQDRSKVTRAFFKR